MGKKKKAAKVSKKSAPRPARLARNVSAAANAPSQTQSNQSREAASAAVLVPKPSERRLRGYAFDPSLSERLETALINHTTYRVRWEEPGDEGLSPGPVGEYLEVVDYDPASNAFYAPVNLNDPNILAQDGLAPSEGNPQFHQQFVYAVAMTTIENFEQALGRPALWAPRELAEGDIPKEAPFVRRLRVYPHALRDANAYYSPDKKALLFGYFPASADRPDRYLPGGLVFTCLSHDIIAHETTHALLDGMHRRFIEVSHRDALAFHEAFADIVALFQRFSFADVLRHQIRRTRGDLSSPNLLGELAQQFGEAIGNYGALRSALGSYDEHGRWQPLKPDPNDYVTITEPHARGAILVAAVFDAFIAIYRSRVADLLRIASSGTGILPAGELHPDLVNRLADEAAKAARHVLGMCVRALDYCPPVDISFGDYLRALVTADGDLVPNDDLGYRLAMIEAFRRRGIYPRDVRTLSVESLRWPNVDTDNIRFFEPLAQELRRVADKFRYAKNRQDIFTRTEEVSAELNQWIKSEGHGHLEQFSNAAGITFKFDLPGLRGNPKRDPVPKFQIYALRPAHRIGPDGTSLNQLILSIVQTRDVTADETSKEKMKFRGGCTLILDLDTMELRYTIRKDIRDKQRLERYRAYRRELAEDGSVRATYFRSLTGAHEPFALLHRAAEGGSP